MQKTLFASALAIGLAISPAVWAQAQSKSSTGAPEKQAEAQSMNRQETKMQNQQPGTSNSVLTVNKLKQELQNAGFSDIKVLEDAFVVQAKTKEGNPILLTLGPSGMSAMEILNPGSPNKQAGTKESSPTGSSQNPSSASQQHK